MPENEGIDFDDAPALLASARTAIAEVKDVAAQFQANRALDSEDGREWSADEKLAFATEINEAIAALSALGAEVLSAIAD